MDATQFDFKISRNSITRRLSLPAVPTPTWEVLSELIWSRFDFEDSFGLSYVDEDGDAIVLSSDAELKELWQSLASEGPFEDYSFTVFPLATGAPRSTAIPSVDEALLATIRAVIAQDPSLVESIHQVLRESAGVSIFMLVVRLAGEEGEAATANFVHPLRSPVLSPFLLPSTKSRSQRTPITESTPPLPRSSMASPSSSPTASSPRESAAQERRSPCCARRRILGSLTPLEDSARTL